MNLFISFVLASLAQIATNPNATTYVALAAVHLIVMRCYLAHANGLTLAFCAGLTAILYIVLAVLHLAH